MLGHSWKICQGSSSVQTCRTTSALTDRAYSAAGQADSVLHSMAALQVFQAMDESVPGPATFKELRSATDLALCATKITAQAIGRLMASLVVLERHLWLNLIEIKNADRTAFLNSPVSTTGLFGSAVDCFVERFTAAQKSSQAFASHFSNKRSSHKAQSTQQPVKSALSPAQPKSKPEPELPPTAPSAYQALPLIQAPEPSPPKGRWALSRRSRFDLSGEKRRGLSPAEAWVLDALFTHSLCMCPNKLPLG